MCERVCLLYSLYILSCLPFDCIKLVSHFIWLEQSWYEHQEWEKTWRKEKAYSIMKSNYSTKLLKLKENEWTRKTQNTPHTLLPTDEWREANKPTYTHRKKPVCFHLPRFSNFKYQQFKSLFRFNVLNELTIKFQVYC